MDRLTYQDLATATGGRLQAVDPRATCARIETDSRTLSPGDVFWALPGERYDGHDFAADALARGARLIACAEARAAAIAGPRLIVDDTLAAFGRLARWYRRRLDTLVIGITGSVGKTTTRALTCAALSGQFHGVQSPGSFNNLVGLPKSLLLIESQHEFAVLEFGASRVGDIRALTALAEPEIGVVTAIGKAHLASFGSVEGIVQGKGELLAALPAAGFAVVAGDDPLMAGVAARAACPVIRVGEGPGNQLRAEDVRAGRDWLEFQADGQRYAAPLSGRHHLSNVLCAVAVARELGVAPAVIAQGLAEFQAVPGRSRVLPLGDWTVVDDTYNASPTSVAAACRLLADLAAPRGARRLLVLGDMLELGPAAEAEHAAIGRLAAGLGIDGVIAYGEHAQALVAGARQGGLSAGQLAATRDVDVLLAVLDCWLEPGAVVVVKGSRGMRMERVVEWLERRAATTGGSAPAAFRKCA